MAPTDVLLAEAAARLSLRLAEAQSHLQSCSVSAGGFSSPFSIACALLLAINAAEPGSTTQAELLQLLIGSGDNASQQEAELNAAMAATLQRLLAPPPSASAASDAVDGAGGAELLVASSIWCKSTISIRPAYAAAMAEHLQATARTAASVSEINAWGSEATRGLIPEMVPPGTPFDAVLANALYFKGLWAQPFDVAETQELPFTTAAGDVKQVPTMSRIFKRAAQGHQARALFRGGEFKAVRLPYQGGCLSAIALLPDDPAATTAQLAAIDLHALAHGDWRPPGPGGQLRVLLPRFAVRSQLQLTPLLKRAGVVAAFGGAADFGRLSETPLHISDVIHTAVVEVDEKGTEAAATTAVVMMRAMLMVAPPEEVWFDRPFLFVIVDDHSGLPLFSGVVTDPSAAR